MKFQPSRPEKIRPGDSRRGRQQERIRVSGLNLKCGAVGQWGNGESHSKDNQTEP